MKFKKVKEKKIELVKVTNRGMNQIVGAFRQVNYKDTSERNMYLIEGMVRTLGYINASKNLALYFNRKIDDMERRYRYEIRKHETNIRKLKSQREYRDETFPPAEFMTVLPEGVKKC